MKNTPKKTKATQRGFIYLDTSKYRVSAECMSRVRTRVTIYDHIYSVYVYMVIFHQYRRFSGV